jgi:hypothetical protein
MTGWRLEICNDLGETLHIDIKGNTADEAQRNAYEICRSLIKLSDNDIESYLIYQIFEEDTEKEA